VAANVGFPAERGFTGAFVLGLGASMVALAATVAVPGRVGNPLLQEARGDAAPVTS
jgi:hypothetical protein